MSRDLKYTKEVIKQTAQMAALLVVILLIIGFIEKIVAPVIMWPWVIHIAVGIIVGLFGFLLALGLIAAIVLLATRL